MPNFTIEYEQNKEEGLYRLCSGEYAGPLVGFGDVATLQIPGDPNIYYCTIENPETDAPDVFKIVQGKKVAVAEMDPVDNFEPDEEEQDEEEEEEDEEEEEQEGPVIVE